MKLKMLKKVILCLALVCMLGMAAGCGKVKEALTVDDMDMNTVLVKEDGTVESLVAEEFGDAYSEAELKSYVQDAVDAYNSAAGADSVTLNELAVKDGKAVMVLGYRDAAAFAEFNDMELAVTVGNQAEKPESLLDAKGKEADVSKALTDKYTAVVLGTPEEGENPYRVIVQGKIAYYYGGELDGKDTVTGNGTEKIFAIYK